jgi:hypothetical protein
MTPQPGIPAGFPAGARCVFRTVSISTYWKTGLLTGSPVLDLDNRPVMVTATDPEGRAWNTGIRNVLQTGWDRTT